MGVNKKKKKAANKINVIRCTTATIIYLGDGKVILFEYNIVIRAQSTL